MDITRITDTYNPNKVWVIKRTKCGHYYVNQEIYGRKFYSAFQRTTKRYIKEILPL